MYVYIYIYISIYSLQDASQTHFCRPQASRPCCEGEPRPALLARLRSMLRSIMPRAFGSNQMINSNDIRYITHNTNQNTTKHFGSNRISR